MWLENLNADKSYLNFLPADPDNVVGRSNKVYFEERLNRKGITRDSTTDHPVRRVSDDTYRRNFESLCRGQRPTVRWFTCPWFKPLLLNILLVKFSLSFSFYFLWGFLLFLIFPSFVVCFLSQFIFILLYFYSFDAVLILFINCSCLQKNRNTCRLVRSEGVLWYHKVEILRKKPPILVFHDVFSSQLMREFVVLAKEEVDHNEAYFYLKNRAETHLPFWLHYKRSFINI